MEGFFFQQGAKSSCKCIVITHPSSLNLILSIIAHIYPIINDLEFDAYENEVNYYRWLFFEEDSGMFFTWAHPACALVNVNLTYIFSEEIVKTKQSIYLFIFKISVFIILLTLVFCAFKYIYIYIVLAVLKFLMLLRCSPNSACSPQCTCCIMQRI